MQREKPLPVKRFQAVTHIGVLQGRQVNAGRHSYEGEGLSVSRCPSDWSRIARLGGLSWWVVRRKDGWPIQFVDLHKLKPAQVKALVSPKYAVKDRVQWQTVYYDDEMETELCDLFDTKQEAQEDAEMNERDAPKKVLVWRATPLLQARYRENFKGELGVAFTSGGAFERDYALVCALEDLGYQGAWWTDRNDGYMSAPRGVIFPSVWSDFVAQDVKNCTDDDCGDDGDCDEDVPDEDEDDADGDY